MREIFRFGITVSIGTISVNLILYYYPNIYILYVLLISFGLQVIVGFSLGRLFPDPITLYDIIATCPTRRRNGPYYCGICPQGYECAKKVTLQRDEE